MYDANLNVTFSTVKRQGAPKQQKQGFFCRRHHDWSFQVITLAVKGTTAAQKIEKQL